MLNGFVEEVATLGLVNVMVTQSGCLGHCEAEPVVEVTDPKGNVATQMFVKSIVTSDKKISYQEANHILRKQDSDIKSDMKSQVTVDYANPSDIKIVSVLMSIQHDPDFNEKEFKAQQIRPLFRGKSDIVRVYP